ncbi:MAG: dihydroorotate dehydrogenase-like protein [Bacteroidales bacterium]|jgi:dihydroorotate dehydrogenase (fumarate)|nr:dihydroorotate dehydrogenase-like protein [Bacteroidales bacterium]
MTDLSTYYMGLPVHSPIVAASSALTASLAQIIELEKYGAGAVVLKSLFEEEIVVELDRRMNKMHAENYIYPETIEFYEDRDVDDILTGYLKLIFEAKKNLDIPVIASINCVTSGNWHYFAKYIQEAGADGLELNIFTLPADIATPGKDYEEAALKIVKDTMAEVFIPLSVKISPYYSGLANMISQFDQLGVKGVALFNRYFSPDFDMDELLMKPGPIYSDEGDYLNSLRWIALLSGKVGCDLYATNGIHDGLTVAKMIAAGAQGVQVASSLYKNGIAHISTLNRQLAEWMEKKEFGGLEQLRGILSHNNMENPAGLLRVQFMRHFAGK